jgi:DNA invertase Pin-like site-specific DNA recombinase
MIRRHRRVAIYVRVSTDGQTCANQERELRAVAETKDCEIVKVYQDHGISGAKGRDKRPQFDALCRDAIRREFDVVMAWSVDRLGRSLQDLIAFLGEIHAAGVDLYLHQQGLDTSTPAGKAMFQMLGVFAEFERALIRERVMAGLERAKEQGKVLGRPAVGAKTEATIKRLLKKGTGTKKTAAMAGVGIGTVIRLKRELGFEVQPMTRKVEAGAE